MRTKPHHPALNPNGDPVSIEKTTPDTCLTVVGIEHDSFTGRQPYCSGRSVAN